jgi:hypothetical protein
LIESDVYNFFANNRPILSSIQGLQESAHRSAGELTKARRAGAPTSRTVWSAGRDGTCAGDHPTVYGKRVDVIKSVGNL